MVLEIASDIFFVCFGVNEFVELGHIELVSNSNHSLVPTHELFFKLDP